jgi:sugar phosphate isomerase/epimerase
MEKFSRRDMNSLLVAGSAAALARDVPLRGASRVRSTFRGITIGAQSYSFRDRPLDACIEAYAKVGIGLCELWSGHVEPFGIKKEEVWGWHRKTPLSHWHQVREKFDRAGIPLFAYTIGFRGELTGEDIERCFREAQALGVKVITSSGTVSVAPRVDEAARKFKITVGFHGHDAIDRPDEFSTAETFARALKGASKYLAVNLDLGHFAAAGGDPIGYIKANHHRIVALHVKDRKKNRGPNLPFGQGDTPIVESLRLLRDRRWRIPANIEYEYGLPKSGYDTIAEVRKCLEYCRQALES